MKANIGLSEKVSQQIATLLNKLLADEFVLYTKTRNCHWNYEGDNFMEMHKFFEGQYEELAEMIDSVAERVRKIGHYAEGRLKEYLEITQLKEQAITNDQQKQVKHLLTDHETLVRSLRKSVDQVTTEWKDAGTADFLTGILEAHEKMAWMLRSYLK